MPPSSATSSPNIQADPGLVCRLEAHAIDAWPATVSERVEGGWVLRATPGLDRGRSNHALTPCRSLNSSELPAAIARVEAFAERHGIPAGIQVSPVSLHGTLMAELDRRGWGKRWPVLVLAAPVGAVRGAASELVLDVADRSPTRGRTSHICKSRSATRRRWRCTPRWVSARPAATATASPLGKKLQHGRSFFPGEVA